MPYIYWDSTYILVVIGAVICMIASARVKTTFNKYSAYRSMSGMTGAQAAERTVHILCLKSCKVIRRQPLKLIHYFIILSHLFCLVFLSLFLSITQK